ncbi:hypothetical protein [Candidatus Uabimicrobium amorphum]|uniref:Chromosome partition protein Smc n=1 Tax=Uabimicrobium amorphum TaxID=2596890 RepID=A0A5S9F2H0_UABAM|nr:hypothetical protein [Candidatus Uabimicrobium amorphum]BBM82449.1 chromosome partition protein Smc [Candidatus Uabimicrobium amorphum]
MKKSIFIILVIVSCGHLFAGGINYKLAIENKVLKKQIWQLTHALKQAKATNNAAQCQITLLEKKNAKLQKQYDAVLCEKQELAKTVHQLQIQEQQLAQTIHELQTHATSYEDKYNNACKEIAQVKNAYSVVCSERDEWKSKCHQLQNNNVFKTKYKNTHKKLADLRSQYTSVCEERNGFKKQCKSALAKVQVLEEQVVCLQKENATLKSKNTCVPQTPINLGQKPACNANVGQVVKLQFHQIFPHYKGKKIVKTLQNAGWKVANHNSDYFGNMVVNVAIQKPNSLKKIFRQVKKTLRSSGVNVKLHSISTNTISIIPS